MATQVLIRYGTKVHLFPVRAFGVGAHPITRQYSYLRETEPNPVTETSPSTNPANQPSNAQSHPRQQSLLRQKTDETQTLANFQQLAKLQTKIRKGNLTLPTSRAAIEEKLAKQEQLVAQLDMEILHPRTPSSDSPKEHPRRPYQRPRSSPKWHQGMQSSVQGTELVSEPDSNMGRIPNSNYTRENDIELVLTLASDTRTLHNVGPAYLDMVARCVVPNTSEFYLKVINALMSPYVQNQPLAARVMEDAKSLGLATPDMQTAVYSSYPRVVSKQQELTEAKPKLSPREPQIHSSYTKGSHTWRTVADYRRLVATSLELSSDMRMLLYSMLDEADFTGCREALEYMAQNNIPFPNSHTCEYLLASAVRAQDLQFAEWMLATLAASNSATESMYSCVASSKCDLKDFRGAIGTYTAARASGLTSYDGLRILMTAATQVGDLYTFAQVASQMKELQSNLFTLTSLSLLNLLRQQGSAECTQLLLFANALLRPDYRFYTSLLHMAASIDDHERFYSILEEMRANGILPTMTSFRELIASLQRTGRGTSETYKRVLDAIHSRGIVPDSGFLASISNGQYQQPEMISHEPQKSRDDRPHDRIHPTAIVTPVTTQPTAIVTPVTAQPTSIVTPLTTQPAAVTPATTTAKVTPVTILPRERQTLRAAVSLLDKHGIRGALEILASKQSSLDLRFYNSLLQTLAKNQRIRECREILRDMEVRGIAPDETSFNLVFSATNNPRIEDYRKLVDDMKAKGVSISERTYNRLLKLLYIQRQWTEFDTVLDEMRAAAVDFTVSTHVTILKAAGRRGNLQVAVGAAEAIKATGAPLREDAYTSLIMAACAQNATAQAVQYLDEMKGKRLQPQLVACNGIMQSWAKSGAAKECAKLLEEMKGLGVKADAESYATVLKASLNQPGQGLKGMSGVTWEFCGWLLSTMQENGVTPNEHIYTQIVEYMAKRGSRGHFNEICAMMREQNMQPDIKLYTQLVGSLVNTHEFEQAMAVIHDMRNGSLHASGFIYATLLNGLMSAKKWDDCDKVLADLKNTSKDANAVTACTKLVEAGKRGNLVECSKITALLQPINKKS